jgi:excisionase family DNA binding protein
MKKAQINMEALSACSEERLKPEQEFLTRVELAQMLRISVRKVDAMIAEREIPVLRLGKSVRFRWCEVEAHLSAKYRVAAEGTDGHGQNTDSNSEGTEKAIQPRITRMARI